MRPSINVKQFAARKIETRALSVIGCPSQRCGFLRCGKAGRLFSRYWAARASFTASATLPDLLPLENTAPESASERQHEYPVYVRAAFPEGETPLRLAHWLIPNRLLVGRYPFVHNQYSDRQHAEYQIKSLLESGVTTFLCLQAELPPQCEMKPRGYGGFYAYKPVATMLHASAGEPPDTELTALHFDLRLHVSCKGRVNAEIALQIKGSIRNKHLDQFLPQKRSAGAQKRIFSSSTRNLDFLHFPITDLSVPKEAGVQGLIKDLLSRLERGEVIYMHCWGGRGRAGTIGACLLKAAYGIDGDEALQRVQRSFDTRNEENFDGTLRKSPETQEQLQFVRSFQYAL